MGKGCVTDCGEYVRSTFSDYEWKWLLLLVLFLLFSGSPILSMLQPLLPLIEAYWMLMEYGAAVSCIKTRVTVTFIEIYFLPQSNPSSSSSSRNLCDVLDQSDFISDNFVGSFN